MVCLKCKTFLKCEDDYGVDYGLCENCSTPELEARLEKINKPLMKKFDSDIDDKS